MTMHEYLAKVPITRDQIQRKVLDFMHGRNDCALVGAWAVNLYVPLEDERLTADIDLVATNQGVLAELIWAHLVSNFSADFKLMPYADMVRIFFSLKPVVDVVQVPTLPEVNRIEAIPVVTLEELIAMKRKAIADRGHTPKGLTDQADLMRLEMVQEQRRKHA
ncbi:MAG: hypothetical protein HY201_05665 [Nitrospirae bacterium]|nr:hypothetical protein [Candidatus Troglogloeales bacterium]MBI3598913.1 hypothetical protein [Candidatus Troglogloeales bacterium]